MARDSEFDAPGHIAGVKKALTKGYDPTEPMNTDYEEAYKLAKEAALVAGYHIPVFVCYNPMTKKLVVLNSNAYKADHSLVTLRIFISTNVGIQGFTFNYGNCL